MKNSQLSKSQHAVYTLMYHIVFVTKYRRRVLIPQMRQPMAETASALPQAHEGSLIDLNIDMDHVHLLVSLKPDTAPAGMVCILKTQLSKMLRSSFGDVITQALWGDHLWSPSYFIATTGGVSIDILKAYVESQQTEEHHLKYTNR